MKSCDAQFSQYLVRSWGNFQLRLRGSRCAFSDFSVNIFGMENRLGLVWFLSTVMGYRWDK